MTMKKILLICCLLGLAAACAPIAASAPPTHARHRAACLVASYPIRRSLCRDQNGYYTDEGLEVTLLAGGPGVDRLTPVLDGGAQFGIASPDELIMARSEGKPPVFK